MVSNIGKREPVREEEKIRQEKLRGRAASPMY